MSFDWPFGLSAYLALVCGSLLLLALLVLRSNRVRNPRVRLLLFALRAAALAILLLILARPVRRDKSTRTEPNEQCLFLVDTSESMGFEHPVSRLQQVNEIIEPVFAEPESGNLPRLAFFDTELYFPKQDGAAQQPEPAGKLTNLGAALHALLLAVQSLPVGKVVLCSDGRIHDREELARAVRLAKRSGVPVSTLTVGAERPLLNLAIRNCFVERHVPPDATVPVRLLVEGSGVDTQDVPVRLKAATGRVLIEETFTARDGLTELTIPLNAGKMSAQYTVELSQVAGELTFADNSFSFRMEVSDPRTRVLYMEGSNHRDTQWGQWEYDFLRKAFLEASNIEVDVLTVDEQLAQGGRLFRLENPPEGFPQTREELFEYDLVICSDINRFIFTAEQLDWTVELVAERGGGFCMVGGYTAFGAGGWDKTVWEKMIPVDMTTLAEGYANEEFVPAIAKAVRQHPILQIDPDPAQNDLILDSHPPFRGTNLVNRAKPGATVLAVHPGRGMPIICVQPYGRGRSMAFTSDAAGGWGDFVQTRWGEGDSDNRHYRRFWVNAVNWLSENSLARHRTHLAGNTEAVSYQPGSVVKVRARLLRPLDMEELRQVAVRAGFEHDSASGIKLRLDEGTADFVGELKLPDSLEDDEATIHFTASDANDLQLGEDRAVIRILHIEREFVDTTPDRDLMVQLAQATDGTVITEPAMLRDLLMRAPDKAPDEQAGVAVPAWDRPWLWAVFVLLLGAEWVIRRLARS